MLHLQKIQFDRRKALPGFPFNVPVIQALHRITFKTPVTFLVGDNGSGKSTFLEALACAIGSITIGNESVKTDKTLSQIRPLARCFKLTWHNKTQKGFFLRAEDFFGYAKEIARLREDLQAELGEVEKQFADRSELAKMLARMPFRGELQRLQEAYGEGLDACSHGESFFALFESRFVPGGLYLIDEPEAPLSPLRQLAFISMIQEMISREAQFIIATHSPILLAFPGATILNFDGGKIHETTYDALEHVKLTRDFLNHPESFLRKLM